MFCTSRVQIIDRQKPNVAWIYNEQPNTVLVILRELFSLKQFS